MRIPARLLWLFVLAGSAVAPAVPAGELQASTQKAGSLPAFEDLRPLLPVNGAAVDARPVFQVAFDAVAPREARRMRFRIALESSNSAGEGYVFDQRRRRSGWLVTADGTAVFRPPRPISDGEYSWRLAAWNGVEWVDAGETRELRVDTVPPAPVEGMRLLHRRNPESVQLVWRPVVLDENGAPEFVTRYHVYRYSQGPDLPHVRAFEVGVVEVPEFTDTLPAEGERILYYRIAAEDEAGNVSARKEPETAPFN